MRRRPVSLTVLCNRLVMLAVCGSLSAWASPALADDGTARAMMGIFGANPYNPESVQPKSGDLKTLLVDATEKRGKFESMQQKAEQGDANAQYELGEMYEYGVGVAPSDYEAVKWYEKAAAQGNADAQERLAERKRRADGAAVEEKAAAERKALGEKAAAERAAGLERLPACGSDAAVDALKGVLGDKLIDWDKDGFCENEVSDGVRQCIGHVTLTTGNIRIAFTFRHAKSDPNSILTQVRTIPTDSELEHRFAGGDESARDDFKLSIEACDRKKN